MVTISIFKSIPMTYLSEVSQKILIFNYFINKQNSKTGKIYILPVLEF